MSTNEKMSVADRIRAARRYRAYVRARQQDAPLPEITEITQAIMSELSRKGIECSSAQIARAYTYDLRGRRPQGRPPSSGKVALQRRVEALEAGIRAALRALGRGEDCSTSLRAALRREAP